MPAHTPLRLYKRLAAEAENMPDLQTVGGDRQIKRDIGKKWREIIK